MKKMKVLLLGNTAGVMYPMNKWLNENGHEAKLCIRYEQDKMYQVANLEGVVAVDTPLDFFKMSIKLIRKFKPDIIHLSSVAKLLPLIRIFAMRTPVIYVHHGPGKRNFIGDYDVVTALADFVQLSTLDIKAKGVWVDRLIKDIFYDRGGRKKNTAVMYYNSYFYKDHREMAKKWAEDNGIELVFLDMTKGQSMKHDKLPEFLSKFEYFLDWKGMEDGINGEPCVSTIAMEAYACGCKVIHDSNINLVLTNLKITTPEDYYEIYKSLEKSSRKRALCRIPSVLKSLMLWLKQGLIKKWKR